MSLNVNCAPAKRTPDGATSPNPTGTVCGSLGPLSNPKFMIAQFASTMLAKKAAIQAAVPMWLLSGRIEINAASQFSGGLLYVSCTQGSSRTEGLLDGMSESIQ